MFEQLDETVADPPPTPLEVAAALTAFDAGLKDDDGLLDVAVAAYKHVAFAQAAMLEALAELHRRFEAEDAPLPPSGREPLLDVAAELAPAAGLAPGTANNLVDLAIALATKLPRTLEALRRGETDVLKARVVADVTQQLDPASRRQVEDVGLRDAPNCSPRQLRRRLEAEAIRADPDAADKRHKAARERRRVEHYAEPDGMGTLVLHGPAEKTAAIFEMADHQARCGYSAGDKRSLDQRRFDAVYDLLFDAATGGRHPGGVGEVQIVISASTLLGLNERPALLKGYGPITAGSARELAKDARWRRIVTDPLDGRPLEVGRTAYRPPKRLERFVKIRDMTCVEPTCDRDARSAQIDHSTNYPDGPTAEHNLGSMCEPGHNRKTRKSATVEQPQPGVFVWTTRLGRRYRVDRKPLEEFTDDDLERDPPF